MFEGIVRFPFWLFHSIAISSLLTENYFELTKEWTVTLSVSFQSSRIILHLCSIFILWLWLPSLVLPSPTDDFKKQMAANSFINFISRFFLQHLLFCFWCPFFQFPCIQFWMVLVSTLVVLILLCFSTSLFGLLQLATWILVHVLWLAVVAPIPYINYETSNVSIILIGWTTIPVAWTILIGCMYSTLLFACLIPWCVEYCAHVEISSLVTHCC